MHNLLVRVMWLVLVLAFVLTGCEEKDGPISTDPPLSDDAALEAMHVIEERVSELRGLEAREPVTKSFLTAEELRQRVEEDFFEDMTEQKVRDEELLYVAFEFIESDLDLHTLYLDLYTEQVAGFYDTDTNELYIIKGSQSPGALERSTFSHEYAHALQDQHFDLEALGFTDEDEDKAGAEDSERDYAVQSLIEGDATLLQQQYMLQHFDFDDLQEMLNQINEYDMSVMDSAPAFLSESLMFPYEAGFAFVTALFSDGGWTAVDAAYANPPLSTEQILHPDRYPDDVPHIVTLPPLTDTLGSGWRLVDEDVAGEFGLQLYLDVHIDRSEAEAAAEGWGGDRYAAYWRDDEGAFVLVLRLAWDTLTDAAEFFDSYVQFAEDRFGKGPAHTEGDTRWWSGDDVLLLSRNSQHETLIIIAPDEATLGAVHGLFPDF